MLSQVDTLTRVKLLSDISQSPCCIEYNRLKLGSVNFQDSKNGAWRVTTLNLGYAVCSRYARVGIFIHSKHSLECKLYFL